MDWGSMIFFFDFDIDSMGPIVTASPVLICTGLFPSSMTSSGNSQLPEESL